jgi:hypothetical protein
MDTALILGAVVFQNKDCRNCQEHVGHASAERARIAGSGLTWLTHPESSKRWGWVRQE